jgi:proteasome lid subunit RPN8/RPN11
VVDDQGSGRADARLNPGAGDPEAYYPGGAGRLHPGPAFVALPRAVRDALIAHARAEAPNEACGIVIGDRPAADGGRALRWVPLRNPLASPYRYSIDPDDLLRLTIETDDADEVFWAIVHSHTASPARPSPTDLREAHYPDALYVLVSLAPDQAAADGTPGVRAWRIVDGGVHEVALTIDG